jgi:hypothetical protein
MASFQTNRMKYLLATAGLNWPSDDIRVLLVKGTYSPSRAHNFASSAAAHEVAGTNYSRPTLAGKAVTQNDVDNRAELDCDDVTLAGVTFNDPVTGAVIYKRVTTDADSPYLAFIDLSATPLQSSGADVTLRIAASGVLRIREPS